MAKRIEARGSVPEFRPRTSVPDVRLVCDSGRRVAEPPDDDGDRFVVIALWAALGLLIGLFGVLPWSLVTAGLWLKPWHATALAVIGFFNTIPILIGFMRVHRARRARGRRP